MPSSAVSSQPRKARRRQQRLNFEDSKFHGDATGRKKGPCDDFRADRPLATQTAASRPLKARDPPRPLSWSGVAETILTSCGARSPVWGFPEREEKEKDQRQHTDGNSRSCGEKSPGRCCSDQQEAKRHLQHKMRPSGATCNKRPSAFSPPLSSNGTGAQGTPGISERFDEIGSGKLTFLRLCCNPTAGLEKPVCAECNTWNPVEGGGGGDSPGVTHWCCWRRTARPVIREDKNSEKKMSDLVSSN